jgi:two-component system sensor histidine kinase KdpD
MWKARAIPSAGRISSELLDAGIDVYTTLNVQHLESLNDVVGRISGIRVWETVPDTVLEEADEVELVDLPPDDFLQRLKEGKVYIPAQAERAIQNFLQREPHRAARARAPTHRRSGRCLDARVSQNRIDCTHLTSQRTAYRLYRRR